MKDYLIWLGETDTKWWNDSAVISEVEEAIKHGAVGATTNPPLIAAAILKHPEAFKEVLKNIPRDLPAAEKGEAIIEAVVVKLASLFTETYKNTNGLNGYVCAEVDPRKSYDADFLYSQAKRFAAFAPNISVKLPVTVAGLEALEKCIADGISVTATISFTFPQVIAVDKYYRRGAEAARKAGKKPGRCFAVIMVGRISDFMQTIITERKLDIPASYAKLAGVIIMKRAYKYFVANNCEPSLMPAAYREETQIDLLSGAKLTMAIAPKMQTKVPNMEATFTPHIDEPIDEEIIKTLETIPEFRMAYEPDGLSEGEFASFGVVQMTIAQFNECWKQIEEYTYLD